MTNPAQVASMDAPQHNARVYILSIVTSMGAFLFGYDLAFIGTSIELAPFQRCVDNTLSHGLQRTNYPKGLRIRWRI